MFENNQKEYITNPPSEDAYPIVAALFINKRFNNRVIKVNSLSLTILDLIRKGQIKCDIDVKESYNVNKKITNDDFEVMKNITLRIANSGELKTSETLAINLLKTMNKSKKFNLKDMLKQSNNTSIANKFKKDFIDYKQAVENENGYSPENYRDIVENKKFTSKGKELKNRWNGYQEYLKSQELSEKYPPQSVEENASQIIYGACFDIEKETLELRENDSQLSNFIDKDGYKLLNIIFSNALSNVKEKSKGDGIFYGVNDKYTIPGGG